jgi:H+-transporting ATPase
MAKGISNNSGPNKSQTTVSTVSTVETRVDRGLPESYRDKNKSFAGTDVEEDMDALIEELESHHDHIEDEDEACEDSNSSRYIPPELLRTSRHTGLNDTEVSSRRKKFGLNQMKKEEKQHLIFKFLMFFVGPIQFVMEVSVSIMSLQNNCIVLIIL